MATIEEFEAMEDNDHIIWMEKYLESEGYINFWRLFDYVCRKGNKFFSKKTTIFELNCPAIMNLTTKKELNHRERTALLMVYLKMGKEGEKRLLGILKNQENFNQNISQTQIEQYKKKNKLFGISCEKLREWHICKEDFADCNKYKDD